MLEAERPHSSRGERGKERKSDHPHSGPLERNAQFSLAGLTYLLRTRVATAE
jgi:hypothetical protein